jgi:hypothetical protein
MSPTTTLSKYKRDLVVSLCKYISHQPKMQTRDLSTLLSAANHVLFDSQVAAVVTLEQNAAAVDVLPALNEMRSTDHTTPPPRSHEVPKPAESSSPQGNDNRNESVPGETAVPKHSFDLKLLPAEAEAAVADSATNHSNESLVRSSHRIFTKTQSPRAAMTAATAGASFSPPESPLALASEQQQSKDLDPHHDLSSPQSSSPLQLQLRNHPIDGK